MLRRFRTFVSIACRVAAFLIILIAAVAPRQIAGQLPVVPSPSFDVASVKPAQNNVVRGERLQFLPGGRFTAENMPVCMLITTAYNLPPQSPRISGGPDWIRSERFDVEAKADRAAIPSGSSRKALEGQLRLMLQSLLAERFKLILGRETREMPVYALVVQKGGAKLQKSKIQHDEDCAEGSAIGVACHSLSGGQGRGLHGEAVEISDIARFVENWTDRPVLDKTGLEGLFRVDTSGWTPLIPRQPGQDQGEDLLDPTRPTLYSVFAKLGLKLEPQKASVDVFTIEQIQRPAGN
jgi:uncharacterized protein (TIGR03435 family)